MQQIATPETDRSIQHATVVIKCSIIKVFYLVPNLLLCYVKIALALFKKKIAPRLDMSDSVLIYEIKEGSAKKIQTCHLYFNQPDQLIAFLKSNKINTIICASCPPHFSRSLKIHNFTVKYPSHQNPDMVVKMLTVQAGQKEQHKNQR